MRGSRKGRDRRGGGRLKPPIPLENSNVLNLHSEITDNMP